MHIKDFAPGSPRPVAGDDVSYELVVGREGKPAAKSARIVGAVSVSATESNERADAPLRVTVRIVGTLTLGTAIAACVVFGRAPLWMPLLYLVAGIISFVAYKTDKRAAVHGEWRIPEATLHSIDLVFGIGGGLLAQGVMRHKSSKVSFGVMSGAIFVLHMGALLAVLAGYGPLDWLGWLSA